MTLTDRPRRPKTTGLLSLAVLLVIVSTAACDDGLTGMPTGEGERRELYGATDVYQAMDAPLYAKGGQGLGVGAKGGKKDEPTEGGEQADDSTTVPEEVEPPTTEPAAVATVAVTPSSVSLERGDMQQLSVKLYDASGNELTDRTVSWLTSDSLVATVSSAGLVSALAAGSATITAKSEDVSGAAAVTVVEPSTSSSTWIYPGEDIQAKVNANGTGTVFTLKAGVHRMQQVTPKGGQQFIGEPGAILNGAKLLTNWQGSGPWYVGSQTQSMSGYPSTRCLEGYPRCDVPHDLYINNALQKHVNSRTEVGAGRWFFDYDADRIYIGENPSGKTVEVTDRSYAFGGSASAVTIKGLRIEKYANRAQAGAIAGGSTTGWILENNVVQFNHGFGIRVGSKMLMRSNKVLRNGQVGIGGIGDDVLVEHNEIAYNNTVGYKPSWEAGGTKWVRTSRLTVRGNFVHHNFGPGLWTDIDNIYTLYENNRVEDNWAQGIFHEISYDAVIRYNEVRRNGHGRGGTWLYGAGILVAHSPSVQVYGNLVEDNYNGIAGIQQNRGSGKYGEYKLRNLKVHNNTVTMARGASGIANDDGDTQVTNGGGNFFDHNIYTVGTSKSSWWSWNKAVNWTSWRGYSQDPNGKTGS